MSAIGSPAEAGFTLIESLAVLAITAMISALVFPSVAQMMDSASLARTVASLQGDLRWARGRALASGAPERLAIAPDGQGYAWNGRPSRRWSSPVLLASTDAIAFFADGSASPGDLSLSAGGRRALVEVTATGLVSGGSVAAGRR